MCLSGFGFACVDGVDKVPNLCNSTGEVRLMTGPPHATNVWLLPWVNKTMSSVRRLHATSVHSFLMALLHNFLHLFFGPRSTWKCTHPRGECGNVLQKDLRVELHPFLWWGANHRAKLAPKIRLKQSEKLPFNYSTTGLIE